MGGDEGEEVSGVAAALEGKARAAMGDANVEVKSLITEQAEFCRHIVPAGQHVSTQGKSVASLFVVNRPNSRCMAGSCTEMSQLMGSTIVQSSLRGQQIREVPLATASIQSMSDSRSSTGSPSIMLSRGIHRSFGFGAVDYSL
jgi:hypothetical protein